MKKLIINLEADIPEDVIEDIYKELGVNSDTELAAFLRGVYISSMADNDVFPMDRITVKIQSDDECGGILN